MKHWQKPNLVALSVATALALPVYANDDIEEIVVTAQKREQAIIDVPLSLTAYDGELLKALGVVELDILSDITPGLVIQEQSPNNPGFVIRGITSDSGSAQSAPRVSVYYNGVDVSRSRGSYFELYDIDRVEIVKGPQATLFGTAASVGALSVITAKPQQELAGQIKVSAGNFSARTAQGFITGGNDKIQGRFAFNYRERDGFIDNIAGDPGSQSAGGIAQDDMHGIERTAFRPSLRITPNDDLTIDLVYSYEKNDDTGTSFKNRNFAPTGGDTSPFSFVEMSGSPLSQQVFGKEKLGVERRVDDFNMTVEYHLNDTMTLTSVSGFREFESLEVFDADGTQAWFLEFAEDAEGEQFSQEFRLVDVRDDFIGLYGFNYFDESGSQRVPFNTEESIYLNCAGFIDTGLPCINADGSVNLLTPVLTQGAAEVLPYTGEFSNFGDNRSWSVFADFTYLLSDWELTAGVRYVDETRESGFSAVMPNSVLAGIPLLPVVTTNGERLSAEKDYDAWLPRFNALYALNDDTNVYVTISKGRRSDVLDVSSTFDPAQGVIADVTDVSAEIVWNYETGIKGVVGKYTYAASVFYQDYSDFQVSLQDDSGDIFVANAGSATNIGVELEGTAVITDSLDLFANLAYIDAEIDDDAENGNLAGNRFRLQPEWTFSTGLTYNRQISETFSLVGSVVYSYRSDVFFEPENAPVAGFDISEDAVSLVNARLGIASDDNWAVTLFATNLTDEEYLVDAGNTGGAFGNPTFVAGPPRFYGIEFSYTYGQ